MGLGFELGLGGIWSLEFGVRSLIGFSVLDLGFRIIVVSWLRFLGFGFGRSYWINDDLGLVVRGFF